MQLTGSSRPCDFDVQLPDCDLRTVKAASSISNMTCNHANLSAGPGTETCTEERTRGARGAASSGGWQAACATIMIIAAGLLAINGFYISNL